MLRRATVVLSCSLIFSLTVSAEEVKPIKVLLLCGGCCHDYNVTIDPKTKMKGPGQKDILKKGLEERANCVVDIITTEDKSTKPNLPIYGNPDYAKGYDVVIHDECAADINTQSVVEGVLKPHREDGIPGVNLHCAMHCYRIGKPDQIVENAADPHNLWFNYLGLQSSGHGAQVPISITFKDKDHPITKGLEDWVTIKEEHYNNKKVLPTAHALAGGKQKLGDKENDYVVAWTNEYGDKKTRVFSTTIGHNSETVSDPRYLDLVTRGMLWACDKLNDKYLKPKK